MSQSANTEEWEVWYWPLKNRGNFIRLLFAEAGVEFKDVNDALIVQKRLRSNFLGKWDEEENKDILEQPMAPPFIIHNTKDSENPILISQTEHCVGYVSEKLGLRPKKLEDHYRAQCVVGNVNDLFRDCYNTMFAAQQQGNKTDVIKGLINGRFKIWMEILEKPLTRDKDQKYYFGDKISQADIAVFNIIYGFEKELFPKKGFEKFIKSKYPNLFEHYERIGDRKGIKEFLKKQDESGIPWYPKKLLHVPDVGWSVFTKAINEMVDE